MLVLECYKYRKLQLQNHQNTPKYWLSPSPHWHSFYPACSGTIVALVTELITSMQHLPFAPFWTLASPCLLLLSSCLLLLSSLLSKTNFLLIRVHLALRLVGVYNFDLHPLTCLNPHHNLYCYQPHMRPLVDQQTHLGIFTTTKTPHKKHILFPAKRTLNQHTPCLY